MSLCEENCEFINYNYTNKKAICSCEVKLETPKVEYEIYYPLYKNNLTKLDLSLCKDTKIEISISVKINGSLDKYNPKSGTYEG